MGAAAGMRRKNWAVRGGNEVPLTLKSALEATCGHRGCWVLYLCLSSLPTFPPLHLSLGGQLRVAFEMGLGSGLSHRVDRSTLGPLGGEGVLCCRSDPVLSPEMVHGRACSSCEGKGGAHF